MARDRLPQGLQDDGPRQYHGRDAGPSLRDRSRGRTEVRVRGKPARPRRALGGHLLSGLRRSAHRALRLRNRASADRRRRTLPLLRTTHPRHLVVSALVGALLQASAAGAAAGAAVPRPRPPQPGGQRGFATATFDPLVQDGIRRGAYPGCALAIGRHDTILVARGYGHLTWAAASSAVTPDSTLYDLASLTKVGATTTALMLLVERGKVRL